MRSSRGFDHTDSPVSTASPAHSIVAVLRIHRANRRAHHREYPSLIIVGDNVHQDGDSGWRLNYQRGCRLNCPAPLLSFGIGECIVGPFCTWLQSCRQVDLSRDAREAGWLREGGGAGAESLPVSRRSSIANVNPHGSKIREARRRRSWDWGRYGKHEGIRKGT